MFLLNSVNLKKLMQSCLQLQVQWVRVLFWPQNSLIIFKTNSVKLKKPRMLSFTTTVTVTVTAKSSSHELDKKKFCKIFFEIKLEYPLRSIQLKNPRFLLRYILLWHQENLFHVLWLVLVEINVVSELFNSEFKDTK